MHRREADRRSGRCGREGGGTGLIAPTATGPVFFAAAGWLVAVAGYGVALGKLAVCLEQN